jgi:hypothetical protein
MASKAEAIAALEQAHAKFRANIEALPESAWFEQWLGSWDLSKLLAHMAGWFKEMTPGFARVAKGERPTPEGADYSNADTWNAKFTATATPGWNELPVWDAAYKGYLQAAKDLSEEFYGASADGKPKIGNRLLQGAGIGHFEEHQHELEAWLASRK